MKCNVIHGRRLFVALCAALALASAARAQAPGARKLSDYVNLFTSCNACAHLDSFVIELQQGPEISGHINVYGTGGPEGKFGEHRLIVKAVAANDDGTGGGLETWVVPPDAPLPDPSAVDEGIEDEENLKEL